MVQPAKIRSLSTKETGMLCDHNFASYDILKLTKILTDSVHIMTTLLPYTVPFFPWRIMFNMFLPLRNTKSACSPPPFLNHKITDLLTAAVKIANQPSLHPFRNEASGTQIIKNNDRTSIVICPCRYNRIAKNWKLRRTPPEIRDRPTNGKLANKPDYRYLCDRGR